jgi:hypothetical protein
MLSKAQVTSIAEVLATASIVAVGWALGGAVGAAIVAGIGINLGSNIIQKGGTYLKEKWLSAEYGALNDDIQRALARAFVRTLLALETRYFELPEAKAQPREKKKAIRGFFEQLRDATPTVFADTERIATEQEVREYLYGEPQDARDRLWRHVDGTNLLYTYYGEPFKNFLRDQLNEEFMFQFGEELNTDNRESNKAWRAFQRMLLEGIEADIKSVQGSQKKIREDLKVLEPIRKRLDEIKAIINRRTPDEPFQKGFEQALQSLKEVLDRVSATTQRTESKVDIVVATSDRIETKIDTVERTLSDVQQILGETWQFPNESVDLKTASERTRRYYSNIENIRVYAQTTVQTLTSLEDLSLNAEIKAKIDSEQASLTQIFEEHARLVITAGRGAGKTTFIKQRLRSLCVAVLERIQRKKPPASFLVPIYVELAQLNSDRTGVPYKDGDLLRLILDILGYLPEKHPKQTLGELLDTFKVILLLDGLNELPPRDQSACRTELFRLDQALTSSGKGESLRIALTSRSLGFGKHSDEFEKKGWKVADVLPLDLLDIEYELKQSLGYNLGQRVFARLDPKRRQILSTPQNLDHFIKWCHDRRKDNSTDSDIAEEIVRQPAATFLKHQVDLLLDKLHNEDTPFAEEILNHLAYETVRIGTSFPYSRPEPETGSRPEQTTSNALSISTQILASKNSKIEPEALLARISESGIVIVLKSRNLCRFEHHSFQEFFAACNMQRLWKLDQYLLDARWREPLAIMAGLLERERLSDLLAKARSDPQLYAYILAHVHEPDIEREFLTSKTEHFVHTTEQWATAMARRLRFLFSAWFLFLPVIAYLLSQFAGSSRKVQVLFSFLGFGYLFAFPLVLIRWNNKRFRTKQERLSKYELPNLIEILRTLQARQAMEFVLEKLREIESHWRALEFQEADPRRDFVRQAIARVGKTVSAPVFQTEDEMMEHLSDPLVAASIDLGVLSARGIQSLYEKAVNPIDDPTGMKAMDKLAELYAADSECRERVAQIFKAIALNVDKQYTRQRRKHAAGICQKLEISLVQTQAKRFSIFSRVLAFLKRVWHTRVYTD